MELGRQIKALRQGRGVTQEGLAEALGVTAQAVSKWERDAAAPDIQLLPALSAYFGVTIDELFALDDDTRMERIQNMLWDERALDRAVVERESRFLLEKARREPDSGRPWTLLAQLENHMAQEHRDRAAEYARTALTREPGQKDARRNRVMLTDKGRAAVEGCQAAFQAVSERMLAGFTREERDQLLALRRRMLENLRRPCASDAPQVKKEES